MNVNVWDVGDQIAALVTSKLLVDPQQLGDVNSDLSAIVGP
jgi:hypothetical protein